MRHGGHECGEMGVHPGWSLEALMLLCWQPLAKSESDREHSFLHSTALCHSVHRMKIEQHGVWQSPQALRSQENGGRGSGVVNLSLTSSQSSRTPEVGGGAVCELSPIPTAALVQGHCMQRKKRKQGHMWCGESKRL